MLLLCYIIPPCISKAAVVFHTRHGSSKRHSVATHNNVSATMDKNNPIVIGHVADALVRKPTVTPTPYPDVVTPSTNRNLAKTIPLPFQRRRSPWSVEDDETLYLLLTPIIGIPTVTPRPSPRITHASARNGNAFQDVTENAIIRYYTTLPPSSRIAAENVTPVISAVVLGEEHAKASRVNAVVMNNGMRNMYYHHCYKKTDDNMQTCIYNSTTCMWY